MGYTGARLQLGRLVQSRSRLATGEVILIMIRHKSTRHVLAFLALASTVVAAEIPATGERVQLFDGTSLEHFDTFVFGHGFNHDPEGVFRVQDGMIRVEGMPYGYFITKEEFDDFYLRAEFKWGEATHGRRFAGGVTLLDCLDDHDSGKGRRHP